MRLLGAWLVLFSHSATLLSRPPSLDIPWAHFGLGIFFALSGALVSGSARRSHGALDFGIRRMRRLAPAYLACSLGVVLLVWPLCSDLPLSHTLRPDRWPATWASLVIHGAQWNLPATFTTHAFPSANGSIWTLPYEALLYLILGLLWFGGVRHWSRPLSVPLALWGGASLTCLFLSSHLPGGEIRLAGFRILHLLHFLGFFSGGWCLAELRPRPRLLLVAVSILLVLRLLLGDRAASIGIDLLLLPSMIFLIGSRPCFPGRSLPDWSYGFYLWGWPVQQTWIHFRPALTVPELAVLATLSTLPLAAASWTWIERPFLLRTREPHTNTSDVRP